MNDQYNSAFVTYQTLPSLNKEKSLHNPFDHHYYIRFSGLPKHIGNSFRDVSCFVMLGVFVCLLLVFLFVGVLCVCVCSFGWFLFLYF